MARPSSEVREALDTINRRRVAIDNQIAERRKQLEDLNAQVPALEREFQSSLALEQQAEAAAKTQP